MVLVHGIQDFALSLEPIAEAFRDCYRVVSYDLRGHGDSDNSGIYSISHHLADLQAVLNALELRRPTLVGHSLGGQIVCHYAGLFTEVPKCVVSIEGLGPPMRSRDVPADQRRARERRIVESLLRPTGEGRAIPTREHAVRQIRRNHPRLAASQAERLVNLGTEPHSEGGLRWKWDTRVQTTWISFSSLVTEERWRWIECPVLVVTAAEGAEFWSRRRAISAEEARIDPEELERRLSLFRDCRHVEIARAGHMVHYDQPVELVAAMADFLAQPGR